jgi:hypothetical protein
MKRLLIILGVLALAGLAWALASDTKLVADGGLNTTGYTSADLLADGDVTIKLIDRSGPTVVATYYLVNGVARSLKWNPGVTGIDSLDADLGAATTYCIITLE